MASFPALCVLVKPGTVGLAAACLCHLELRLIMTCSAHSSCECVTAAACRQYLSSLITGMHCETWSHWSQARAQASAQPQDYGSFLGTPLLARIGR